MIFTGVGGDLEYRSADESPSPVAQRHGGRQSLDWLVVCDESGVCTRYRIITATKIATSKSSHISQCRCRHINNVEADTDELVGPFGVNQVVNSPGHSVVNVPGRTFMLHSLVAR